MKLPNKFPAGAKFFDVEGLPVVEYPDGRWFSFWKGDFSPWRTEFKSGFDEPGNARDRNGAPVSLAEFRRLCTEQVTPEQLRDISEEPTFLTAMGFLRRDEETDDADRWIWYEKTYDSDKTNVRLIVQVEFELSISDAPSVPSSSNFSYSFNRVYLRVVNRQMEPDSNQTFDEETECPHEIGRHQVKVTTSAELRALCQMLS